MRIVLILVGMGLLMQQAHAGGCANGQPLNDVLEGHLGSPPAGGSDSLLCFEVNNDTSLDRYEVAYSAVPIAQSWGLTEAQLDRLLVIGPGNQVVASSFRPIAKWGAPLMDSSAAIRWLEVTLPAKVSAQSINTYELLRYAQAPTINDPFALVVSQSTNQIQVNSPVMAVDVGRQNSFLFNEIRLDDDGDFNNALVSVHQGMVGDGPVLLFQRQGVDYLIGGNHNPLDSDRIFRSSFEPAAALPGGQIVVNDIRVIESGTVKVSIQYDGHFMADDGSSLCQNSTTNPYEALGFTAIATLYRGQRLIDMSYEFRNECSDASAGPWVDNTLKVKHASWQLTLMDTPTEHGLVADEINSLNNNTSGLTRVEQHLGRGEGSAWQRQAGSRLTGQSIDQRSHYDAALVAIQNSSFYSSIQMPYLRFREPQAIEAAFNRLGALFVSEPITMGEGKGIWNQFRFRFTPNNDLTQPANGTLQQLSITDRWALERALLIKANLADINAAQVMPTLGDDGPSVLKSNYLAWMNLLHEETVSEDPNQPGQWLRNKTFGSQYWPDTGGNDPFTIDAQRPNESFAGMNYWDPAGLEILEFQRSGEPKWAWELALPVYKSMVHAAYLNIGFYSHGNRAGVAVQSGGPGCEQIESPPGSGIVVVSDCHINGSGGGQWHRSNFGSDDYTYNMSLDLAYITRPSGAMLDRFMMAGTTMVNRYDTSIPENFREDAVSVLNNTRQVIQHWEMLANCAEFVPGQLGQDCHNTLIQLVEEISRDNLQPGLTCQGYPGLVGGMNNSDIPNGATPSTCLTPQQFMVNSLIYPFYYRYLMNYGDTSHNTIRPTLLQMPLTHLQYGIDRINGTDIDPFGQWWTRLFCQLDGTGSQVLSCQSAQDSDGNLNMWTFNKPHTAALLYLGEALDQSGAIYGGPAFCQMMQNLYDTPGFTGTPGSNGLWSDVQHFNQAGWWKGSAQMMQSMVFAVGAYDVCQ